MGSKSVLGHQNEVKIAPKTSSGALGRWGSGALRLWGSLGSPWGVQQELSEATIVIDPAPSHHGRGGSGLPTSLRLGDSEDLRAKKRSYSGSDTPQGRRTIVLMFSYNVSTGDYFCFY